MAILPYKQRQSHAETNYFFWLYFLLLCENNVFHPFFPPGLRASGSSSCAVENGPFGSLLRCLHLLWLTVVLAPLAAFPVSAAIIAPDVQTLLKPPALPSTGRSGGVQLLLIPLQALSWIQMEKQPFPHWWDPLRHRPLFSAASRSWCVTESSWNRYFNFYQLLFCI